MGYSMKWVESHLGITRKAIEGYQNKELISRPNFREYHNFSDDDLDRIWTIRVLNKIGFGLDEIKSIFDGSVDFQDSFEKKYKSLVKSQEETDQYLKFAEYIRLTGEMPCRPKDFSTMNKDYLTEKVLPITSDIDVNQVDGLLNLCFETEECSCEDMINALESAKILLEERSACFIIDGYVKSIIRRIDKSFDNAEIQLMANLLYEEILELDPELQGATKEQIGRIFAKRFVEGKIGEVNVKKYGEAECCFVANVLSVFAGYKNYDDMSKMEVTYD